MQSVNAHKIVNLNNDNGNIGAAAVAKSMVLDIFFLFGPY